MSTVIDITVNGQTGKVDTGADMDQLEEAHPIFFGNAPKGSRETITLYRGFLIVRNTPRGESKRRTIIHVPWKWDDTGKTTIRLVVSDVDDAAQAQRIINRIIETKTYPLPETA